MKVLMVTRKLPPPTNLGAVPTMLLSVAQGLVEAGVEVDILAGPPSKTRIESPRQGLTIHRFDDESVSTIELMSTTKDLLRDVDIVHIHDVLPLGLGILDLIAMSSVPRIWTIHNFSPLCTNSFLWPPCSLVRDRIASGPPDLCYVDRSPDCRRCFRAGFAGRMRCSAFILKSQLARRAASRFHLITPSRASARVVMKAWGLRSRVLANPISLTHPGEPGRKGDILKVFFGGRLVPEKGLDVLIEAMGCLEGLPASLTVSGTGRPAYLDALSNLASKLGVDYAQLDWRPRDEYLRGLGEYDICAVPTSGFEVFGMVALDAEMAGLPLVLVKQGGLKEVAEEGKNALYFDPGDPWSLAEAIRILADRDPMRRRFALRSKGIVEKFGLRRHIKELTAFYDEVTLREG